MITTETQIKKWTKDSLLEELKKRSQPGNSIRFDPLRKNTTFEDAVYEEFGSWKRAIEEAGLHPKTKLINYWTPDEVIKRLKMIAERGEQMNTLALEVNHPRLWNAARRLFNNIESAVQAAGYEYDSVKKRLSWDEDEIRNKIREMYEKGEDITQISMMKKDSKLLAAGQKFYGSWSRAVEKAGIDYAKAKQRHREHKNNEKAEKREKFREVYFMQGGRLIRLDK